MIVTWDLFIRSVLKSVSRPDILKDSISLYCCCKESPTTSYNIM